MAPFRRSRQFFSLAPLPVFSRCVRSAWALPNHDVQSRPTPHPRALTSRCHGSACLSGLLRAPNNEADRTFDLGTGMRGLALSPTTPASTMVGYPHQPGLGPGGMGRGASQSVLVFFATIEQTRAPFIRAQTLPPCGSSPIAFARIALPTQHAMLLPKQTATHRHGYR